MIAAAGSYQLERGDNADLDLNANSGLALPSETSK
jgi:hypothetical protein